MEKFNINDFENFKIFFKNLVDKDKNNKYFVNGMKQIFNNFNDFEPNKSIYNKSKKKFKNLIYKNEDDLNN